jgi:hypothetical protein
VEFGDQPLPRLGEEKCPVSGPSSSWLTTLISHKVTWISYLLVWWNVITFLDLSRPGSEVRRQSHHLTTVGGRCPKSRIPLDCGYVWTKNENIKWNKV